MSDQSYSEKRRALLKTVGITLGTAASGTHVSANTSDDYNSQSDSWTCVRSGPSRRGATDDRGPYPYPATDWKMDLEGSMYDVEPVVADKTVYLAVTTENNPSKCTGFVSAYDLQTGDRQWKQSDLPAPKTPSFNNGTLYFATRGAENVSTEDEGLYAMDANNGSIKWQLSDPQCLSPIVVGNTVYTANSSGAIALDAESGDPIWQVNNVGGIAKRADGALSYTDETLFFNDGTAIDTNAGSIKWKIDGDSIIGSNVGGDKRVYSIRTDYIDGDDTDVAVEARSIADGEVEWTHNAISPNRWDGRLALADGYLFLLDSSNGNSILKALNADTGTKAWTQTTHGELRSDPTIANGTVYIGGWFMPGSNVQEAQSLVYAFDISTGRREWAYLFDDGGLATSPENPPTAGSPIVVYDKLYVVTQPAESTLDYRYINYSNFYALCSSTHQLDSNRRLPTNSPNDSDQQSSLAARIEANPDLDSEDLDAGETLKLDASSSTGRKLAYEWDTNGDGRYDRFGSCIYVTLPRSGSITVELKISGNGQRTDTMTIKVPKNND